MSIWAVTPVKSFKRPKSRLGDVLSLLDRRILVKHMLKSVLFSQEKSNLFKKLREKIITTNPSPPTFPKTI